MECIEFDVELHKGTFGCPHADADISHEVAAQINKQFSRSDGMPTCTVYDDSMGIFFIYATTIQDLAFVH